LTLSTKILLLLILLASRLSQLTASGRAAIAAEPIILSRIAGSPIVA
jgi:hypothetical protein